MHKILAINIPALKCCNFILQKKLNEEIDVADAEVNTDNGIVTMSTYGS